jgi:chromosome segregation ATPase
VSELVEIVDTLETKISRLLFRLNTLREEKDSLEREVKVLKAAHDESQKMAELWENRYNSLKVAHAMLGSETNKTEVKLKINALVKEIDQCMVYFSE